MISEQDETLRRARDFVRDRGWRHEPLTWQEVRLLVSLASDSITYQVGYDNGYDNGCEDGYDNGRAQASAEPLTADRVFDWASDNGYTLTKVVE